MKLYTALAVLSTLSVSVLAQAPPWTGPVDPAKVDPCVANCSLQAAQKLGCDPTSKACVCTPEFTQAATPCILSSNCDISVAQNTSTQVCKYGFIGGAASSSSSSAAGTTGAQPTTGGPASTTGAQPTTGGPASTTGAQPTTGGPAPTTGGGTAPTCKPKARRRAHVRAQL